MGQTNGVGPLVVDFRVVRFELASNGCGIARKLCVEGPGAMDQVINRGNYRREVFETAGAAQAFVTALEETTVAYGWQLRLPPTCPAGPGHP